MGEFILASLGQRPTNTHTASVLVVEDELLIRLAVSDALREAGFIVVEAFNADEAIEILRSGLKIDLLLSDVRMPGSMDGLGLLQYSHDSYPLLPVIITSGHLLSDDALARGARHFLGKPYALEHAIALVELELGKMS
jgi:DNA-binding NtrC family response regulator